MLAGASLIAAGAIQFTRWKMTHLLRCRSPFGCAVSCPQHETSFRLGCKQGAVCCICCAAPMTIQLALGIMNPLRSQQPPRCCVPPSRDFVSGPCAHSPCPGGCGSALVRCATPRNYAHIPSSASSAALRKQDTRGVSYRWRGVLPSKLAPTLWRSSRWSAHRRAVGPRKRLLQREYGPARDRDFVSRPHSLHGMRLRLQIRQGASRARQPQPGSPHSFFARRFGRSRR